MGIDVDSKQNIALNRRKFLGLSAAGMGLMMSSSAAPLWAKAAPPTNAGLQLYTLRDMMAKSVPETLKLVAEIGYKRLEFAGYFDHKPKELRKILDGEGLTAPSAHVPLEVLQKDFDGALAAAEVLGHKYIVVPYLDDKQRGKSIDTYKQLAEQFNEWGEKSAKAGIRLAYHNHDFEFATVDEQIPYDVLLADTAPELVFMELDLFWVIKAQVDPFGLFRDHPGRYPLWHIKDMGKDGKFADVGQGTIDFAKIYQAADVAGLQHDFVENDQPEDALRTITRGFKAMQAIRRAS